ncbi:CBS domain-containing protein [Pseudonocardiaceae bacterium YIM PH 21723]|nr:CBS domain-containing protein [Pseudonocardiaceae bacterium YIM PH 21723]
MTTAREIMTSTVACVLDTAAMSTAAVMMRDLEVGALPVCREDGTLIGMVTDRDIAIQGVASELPASTPIGRLTNMGIYSVDANAHVTDIFNIMSEFQVRRVPVLDGDRLVGIVSQSDVARERSRKETGEVVGQISELRE